MNKIKTRSIVMHQQNKTHDMADNSEAVSQTSINGVMYDIPEWLSPDF
jgi:hypothetical protein